MVLADPLYAGEEPVDDDVMVRWTWYLSIVMVLAAAGILGYLWIRSQKA